MIKKLFVSDLDGTLLNKDKMIDAHSIDVIKKLKLAGHIFCFATGRGWDECKKYYEQLGLDTPCIIFNGSKMVSPKNKYFIPNTHSISNDVFYQL
jgi:HAD superfamily hydrolase (TIGR01484 family)